MLERRRFLTGAGGAAAVAAAVIFTRFQAQLGSWDHVALGAYHEYLKG